VRELEEWQSDLRERLTRWLEEIGAEIAKQVERVNNVTVKLGPGGGTLLEEIP
jgi:hypothetical protein